MLQTQRSGKRLQWVSNPSPGHYHRQHDGPGGLATAALMFLAGPKIYKDMQTKCFYV